MRVQQPIQVNIEEKDDTRNIVELLADANNKNSNDFFRLSKDINFSDNIKTSNSEFDITTESIKTIRHNLGFTPLFYIPTGDHRVERTEKTFASTKDINLKVILKSTFLTAAVVASANLYVANPFIFKVGDVVKVGTVTYTISEVDTATRKIVISAAISVNQFVVVQLYRDKVKFLVA